MPYYDVSPISIVRSDASYFSYSSDTPLLPGQIVTIPAGKKTLTGVVLREIGKPDYETKPISSVLDQPPIPTQLLDLHAWMSDYYVTHPANVWQTILPRGITKKRRKNTISTPVNNQNRTKKVFTKEQTDALKVIDDMTSGTALLHGITGSGKTTVYIESARRASEQKKVFHNSGARDSANLPTCE